MKEDHPRDTSGMVEESEVRWLVSYSDFMMQLVCLFILLFSISTVSEQKAAEVAQSLQNQFGYPLVTEVKSKKGSIPQTNLHATQPSGKVFHGSHPRTQKIKYTIQDLGVLITFETTMFEAGKSQMTSEAEELVSAVRDELKQYLNEIEITGYAAPVPDDSIDEDFWRLSFLRAQSVASILIGTEENPMLDPQRVVVKGNGCNRPLKTDRGANDDVSSRRVEIFVKKLQ